MSATGRSPVRRKDDFYVTPDWCTQAIIPHLPSTPIVMDMGCGQGDIGKHFVKPGVHVLGLELDEFRAIDAEKKGMHVAVCDVLTATFIAPGIPGGLVMMNPPYLHALEFVKRGLELAPGGVVCALLRLGFLASKKRQDFLREHTPRLYVLSKRPSFTGDGKTDASDYGWFVFGGQLGPTIIL